MFTKCLPHLLIIFSLFFLFSCQEGPQKIQERNQEVIPFNKAKIENILLTFNEVADLKYQGAVQILGNATIVYELLSNADNLKMVKQDVRTANTSSNITYVFNDSTNTLIYSDIQKVARRCNNNNDICLNWQKNYYNKGELAEALLFQDTISNLKYPSFEGATLSPRAPGNKMLVKADKAIFEGIRKELDELKLQEGRTYAGKYRYFVDIGSFQECGTQNNFNVESPTLEQRYGQLGTEEEVYTKVLAFVDSLPNIANDLVPTLMVWSLVEMNKSTECPEN